MGNGNQTFSHCHALLPTAGSGSRLGGPLPKQFQGLAGRPMLAYAIEAFCSSPAIESVWVGVPPSFINHPVLGSLVDANKPLHFLPSGGPTRQETVRNTLAAMLATGIPETDWVLVHDAARPGISPQLIQRLITAVTPSGIGGLLALPVADTLKLADLDGTLAGSLIHAEKTISRNHLWQAQTPQMFPLKKLHDAIQDGIRMEADITDESSAMELAGFKPLLIEGEIRNFKVTHPADWSLMEILLSLKGKSSSE